MEHTKYLVVGSSHAALEAVSAIRMHDGEGRLTMVTRDSHLPYSPTVLPYVVSGRSAADGIWLREPGYFSDKGIDYLPSKQLTALRTQERVAEFADGSRIGYDKLLLATGASPLVPPIPGLETVRYHVLRTLDDAVGLNAAMRQSRQAVVLGAGLVGMHAAENLVKAGVGVSIVEMSKQLTSGYFDTAAASLIEKAFAEKGAKIFTGSRVVAVAPSATGTTVTLDDGRTLEADLLLVAAGVRPDMRYLKSDGCEVAHERGILVDDAMRTSVDSVWAAGDCAQARGFFGGDKIMNAILPDAAEQGRIAGMAMAGDPALRTYQGGVAVNTYHFFGCHAISVGSSAVPPGADVVVRHDEQRGHYLKVILHEGRLVGIYGVNVFFDAGIMYQLIVRRTDLTAVRDRFVADPLAVGRELMSATWR